MHGVHADFDAFDPATVLLEGEFSSNTEITDFLRPRPRNISHSIRSDAAPIRSFNLGSSSSQLLERYPAHVKIIKFMTAVSNADLITLLTASILVLSCNPTVFPALHEHSSHMAVVKFVARNFLPRPTWFLLQNTSCGLHSPCLHAVVAYFIRGVSDLHCFLPFILV